MMTFFVDWESF